MPGVALEGMCSTGHGCFPPTDTQSGLASTSFFNGKPIQLATGTIYQPHSCHVTHAGALRTVSQGSGSFFMEGKPVARIGDSIQCGDMIAEGSGDAFIG
jgi:hypothetical protein